jgi:hypothetical protein
VTGVATLLIPDEAATIEWPHFIAPATLLLELSSLT